MKKLWQLFITFFKIGAFTFGGGYSMLPIIQHELCEKQHLLDDEEMATILVLAQSLPGVLAVNAATFIGYKLYQKRGALICAFGVVLPSFLIIILLANLLIKYNDNIHLQNAFTAIRAVVVGMIAAAALKLGKPCYHNKKQLTILLLSLLAVLLLNPHPVILILIGGFLGWQLSIDKAKEAK